MTFTTILFMMSMLLIFGLILGVLKKNKLMMIISGISLAAVICAALFLIFVLIPSM